MFSMNGCAGARVMGDPDRLAQVASNLLSNARSHGRSTDSIDVVVSVESGEVVFSVSNVADALAPATIRTLYAPFKAASLNNTQNRGGMGLGLYITERIVSAHQPPIAYAYADGRVVFTVRNPLAIA